jgi:iron(III) transport system permease protein
LSLEAPAPVAAADLRGASRSDAAQVLARLATLNPLWLVIAPVILVVVGLLLAVLWLSFLEGLPGTAEAHFSLRNYVSLYTDPFVVSALANTAGFAGVTIVVALFFGVAIAWLVERTDLPGKPVVYTLMSLGLLLPTFFLAMGWLFLLSPRIGVINRWIMGLTGLTEAPFDVTSILGMGWVQGLSLAALVFLLVSASFRSMDPALEEAAVVHGATFGQMLRRVFLPLVFPSILASAIYAVTIAIASFDVPAILGLSARIFTFSTFVFTKSLTGEALPEYGSTAAMSMLMVGVAIALAVWYGRILGKANQFQVVTGKGYQPRLTPLGPWSIPAWLFIAAYFALSKVLPFLLVVWAAGLPFFQPPSLQAARNLSLQNFQSIPLELLGRGATNTLILVLTVPTLALLLCFAFSWMVVRSRTRWRGLLDFFAFLPHAVPSIIFAVGAGFIALFVWRQIPVLQWFPIYGTLVLLIVVYVVDRLSFGTRLLNSASTPP